MKHEEKDSMENPDFIFSGDKESYERIHLTDMPSPGNRSDKPEGLPIGGILAGILGVFSIAATYGWITGSWDAEYAIPTIIAVLVGSVVAYFGANSFGYTLLTIETVGFVLLWIYAVIIDFIQGDSLILWIFADIALGPIFAIPVCAFPALVCAILVTIVKMIIHAVKDES